MKKPIIFFMVIIGMFFIYSIGSNLNWLPFGNKDAQAEVTKHTDLIEVNTSNINTTIISENRNDVLAKLDGKGKVQVKERGDKIKITVKRKWIGWNWFPFFDKSKLTVYIPHDYEESIAIRVGSGNLDLTGESENQPLKLEELSVNIDSGNIHVQNVHAKTYKHNGGSGNAEIDSLRTEKGLIHIGSGRLQMNHYIGAIKANISSGQLDIQMDQLNDSIKMDISSGKVNLDIPKNADFKLNGNVSSGVIQNDFPLRNEKKSKNQLQGIYGSGKHNIDLNVSSGLINIY